jgi:tRNA dimethylallyltransferase
LTPENIVSDITLCLLEGKKPRVCFITGSTASGKTSLAHGIFNALKKLGRESCIINTDALQVYTGVSVGVAKPTPFEIEAYQYKNIDFRKPNERIDAHEFAQMTHKVIETEIKKFKICICVGGSGLYLNAILGNLSQNLNGRNDDLRMYFKTYTSVFGLKNSHKFLASIWPERAKQVHANDKIRIERSLEISFSDNFDNFDKNMNFEFDTKVNKSYENFLVYLNINTETLKRNIMLRIDKMIEQGWLEEINILAKTYGERCLQFQSFQAIGYKEIFHFLGRGDASLHHLKEQIFTKTWQYARRQATWNKRFQADLTVTK